MSITTREESPFLYMRFTYKNKAYHESTGVLAEIGTKIEKKNWALAEKREKERREELRLQFNQTASRRAILGVDQEKALQAQAAAAKAKLDDPTFLDFLDVWWKEVGDRDYPEGNGRRFHMRRLYKDKSVALTRVFQAARNHGEFTLADLRLSQIPAAIPRYVGARARQGRSGCTINSEVRALTMFLRSAQDMGYTVQLPSLKVIRRLRQEEHIHSRVVSHDEEASYLMLADPDLAMFVKIMIDTTAEPTPVSEARWEDVHLEPFGDFTNGYFHDRCTKSKFRDRKLGLSGRLAAAFRERWLAAGSPKTGWVFPADRNGSNHHTPLRSFQSAHARLWGRKYGPSRSTGAQERHEPTKRDHWPMMDQSGNERMPYFRLYDLRHTACTRLIDSGVTIYDLKDAAGWASLKAALKMYDTYVHRDETKKAAAFAKLDAALRLIHSDTSTDRSRALIKAGIA